MILSDERCSKALRYLTETDESSADAKTDVARKEYAVELVKKRMFLTTEGSVEHRKALAETSPEVQAAIGELLNAIVAFEKVKAKRQTEALVVDVWRSVNAARRVGNI